MISIGMACEDDIKEIQQSIKQMFVTLLTRKLRGINLLSAEIILKYSK